MVIPRTFALALLLAACGTGVSFADPCGMVPPVYVGDDVPIARVGLQKTYVFHAGGLETLVIRPGFTGKVEEFGMLIPFPTVPAIRKVSDNVFPHIAAAIDPPEVVLDVRPQPRFLALGGAGGGFGGGGGVGGLPVDGLELQRDEVRVEKEEAVGMYEVAVIRAGSPEALQKWMDEHEYRYPEGMDAACEDYIEEKWCFVAVRTRIGAKANVDPKPGMRKVEDGLPKGSSFDGHVQAMGFRFPAKQCVIPMRLSTFNEGELRNIVYILTDEPSGLRSIPREYVVRQVPGEMLLRNVVEPLPLRILGGTVKDLQPFHRAGLAERRDPEPHNGVARDLFASDLLAVAEKRLVHPHEETEKMLLRIGERLDLRGPEIDELHAEVLEGEQEQITARSIALLRGLTLSVVDGDFPREVLASQNLRLSRYRMVHRRNSPQHYDATKFGPNPDRFGRREGVLYHGKISALKEAPTNVAAREAADQTKTAHSPSWPIAFALFGGLGIGVAWIGRRRR